MKSLEQWRTDWSSRDTAAYLSHYAADFKSGNKDYSTWAQQKKLINSGKRWIKVKLTNISVFSYPDQPNLAVVSFDQDYSSNNLNNRMRKRQYWMRHGDHWQIIYEGAA